jgi:drug/metabolite transporter (DMT)-like permease
MRVGGRPRADRETPSRHTRRVSRSAPPAAAAGLIAPGPRDATLLAVAVAGVSFSGPLMAATAAPALAIAFWRNGAGALATVVVALRRPASLRAIRRAPASALRATLLAGALLGAHFGTWVPSLTMTSVASATAMVSSQAIFAALIARRRGMAVRRGAWIGIAVSVAGVVLVTGVDVSLSARAALGDLLALGAGLAAALYMTVGSHARQHLGAAPYTIVCYFTAAGTLLVACLVGGQSLGGYSADAWWKIAAVTVAAQLLGHTLMNVVVATTSPTVVALALLLEVPGAALIAYLWLGQRPPLSALPGLVMIIGGLVAVTRAGATEPAG